MIRTFADLLQKLIAQESAEIEKAGIPHAPTIGLMYEGLTSELLSRLLPDGLDLTMASGFIQSSSGEMSGQIDCMLVSGTGTRLPHTDLFTWQVRDVIAVFEVKKNLFAAELAGSHVHLRKVLDLHWDDFVRAPHGKVNVESAEHAFKMIVGFPPPPREQLPTLPFDIEMIYRALTVEFVSPIRVAFGYSGFRSEKSLRDGFIRFLKKNIGKAGMSPVMLPSLIVSGQYSLLKMNGQPYSGRQYETWWPIFASSHENPLVFVLEIIWTRLSERTEMPEWFDQDLGIEKLALLLGCRAVQQDGKSGWQYDVTEFTETQLREPGEQHTWEPYFLTVFQHTVVAHLCRHDSVGLSESLLHNLSQQEREELEELFEVRLVGYEADRIVLLTRSCRCAILPDGRFAAADDSSGRFSAWVERYLDDRKRR